VPAFRRISAVGVTTERFSVFCLFLALSFLDPFLPDNQQPTVAEREHHPSARIIIEDYYSTDSTRKRHGCFRRRGCLCPQIISPFCKKHNIKILLLQYYYLLLQLHRFLPTILRNNSAYFRMGWWCFSGHCWEDIQRMRKEHVLVKRLKRHFDEWEPNEACVVKMADSIMENPYDRKFLLDSYYHLYGQPLLVGMATLVSLRTGRRLLSSKKLSGYYYYASSSSNNNSSAAFSFDMAGSIGAGAFTFSMLNHCRYMAQTINPEFTKQARNLPLRPGTSDFTDLLCSESLAAIRKLREDKSVDQTLLDDPKLAYLRTILEDERCCSLRFAFQKKIQRAKGIADDSPLCPVPIIPYPGVPNDDRLLLLPDEVDHDVKPSTTTTTTTGDNDDDHRVLDTNGDIQNLVSDVDASEE
jgi:hypothetical protein